MVQAMQELVLKGSGCFSDEWSEACAIMDSADELIGVPPVGDVSAPGGLEPLSAKGEGND
jgi:hypothetical protein